MKKPNRIARKGDSAPARAQVKRGPSTAAKSIRKAAATPAANARKAKPSPESTFADAIGLGESPHGAYVCEVELGPDAHQTLYRRGDGFTLVVSMLSVRDGGAWRTWDEWSEQHPGVSVRSLPKSRLRQQKFADKLSRSQVIAWLWENMGSVVIPEDFAESFRPLGIVHHTSKKMVRESFYELAQLALKDRPQAEERARASFDVMNVATALGFTEEAAQAATILNSFNAAFAAENGLRDMLAAGLAMKS